MAQSKALSNRQIARAAAVVIFGFLTSGALGVIRTAAIAASFGTSDSLDAFIAAQRIPEMLFVLVAGGALGSSFLPVFARFRANGDETGAWRLASSVMTLTAAAAAVFALVVALLAPLLVPTLLVPGKPPEMQALTVSLIQIMLVTAVIFSVSGLLMAILNAHQMFLLPALAPSMYNIGLIFGALVLARAFPPDINVGGELLSNLANGAYRVQVWRFLLPDMATAGVAQANVYGLAGGAVLGALLHLAVQLPALRKIGWRLRVLPDYRIPGAREVLTLMGPRVLGLAVTQINFAVNINFSSSMVSGSLVALNTAWQLMFLALGIIAQSIGTAVFPSLSALAAEGDMAGFKQRLAGALRGVLFLSFPASVGLIVLGMPVIRLLFERGEWTAESSAATAWALAFFAVGIAGHSLLEVLSRAFYALSDTRTPVIIGLVSMVSNIILSFVFIRVIGEPGNLSRGPFAGLALANSLTTILEGLALWYLLRRRIGDLNDRYVIFGAIRAAAAAVGMGVVVWLVTLLAQDYGALITAIAGFGAGAAAFFGLSILIGIDEARTVPGMILRRVRR
ncbi:MAG: murein biosynthesis integral membrane protein MurJ [Burkholderiales bacterium]|nr:murein biosynthesis integral membrane protein MurJ [Anaerolineae bacterium]